MNPVLQERHSLSDRHEEHGGRQLKQVLLSLNLYKVVDGHSE